MPMLNNWILSGLFIITMKTFEITSEQIKHLSDCSPTSWKFFKENFPEAFEPELKTGIWYKSKNEDEFFFYLEKFDYKQSMENYCKSYGFNRNGTWESSDYRSFDLFKNRMTPASEEEVLERLKEEAIKRGFKKGVTVDRSSLNCYFLYNGNKVCKIQHSNFSFIDNEFFIGGHVVLHKGIWAEICITKEEAEKELGKKII